MVPPLVTYSLSLLSGACPGLHQFLESHPITTVEGGHLRTDVRVVEGLFVGRAVIGSGRPRRRDVLCRSHRFCGRSLAGWWGMNGSGSHSSVRFTFFWLVSLSKLNATQAAWRLSSTHSRGVIQNLLLTVGHGVFHVLVGFVEAGDAEVRDVRTGFVGRVGVNILSCFISFFCAIYDIFYSHRVAINVGDA